QPGARHNSRAAAACRDQACSKFTAWACAIAAWDTGPACVWVGRRRLLRGRSWSWAAAQARALPVRPLRCPRGCGRCRRLRASWFAACSTLAGVCRSFGGKVFGGDAVDRAATPGRLKAPLGLATVRQAFNNAPDILLFDIARVACVVDGAAVLQFGVLEYEDLGRDADAKTVRDHVALVLEHAHAQSVLV